MDLSSAPPSFFWLDDLLFHRSVEYYFVSNPKTEDVFLLSSHYALREDRFYVFKTVWGHLNKSHKETYSNILNSLGNYVLLEETHLQMIDYMVLHPKKELKGTLKQVVGLLKSLSRTEHWDNSDPIRLQKFYLSLTEDMQNKVVAKVATPNKKWEDFKVFAEQVSPCCSEENQQILLQAWQNYPSILTTKTYSKGSFPFMEALQEKKNLMDAVIFPKTSSPQKRM